jgi:cytochrome P450
MLHVYEAGFKAILDKFVRRYEAETDEDGWTEAFDLAHDFELLNFDSMGEFCFGKSFGSLDDPEKAKVLWAFMEGFQPLNGVGHMPGLSTLRLDALNPKLLAAMEKYKSYSTLLANECLARFQQEKSYEKEPSSVFEILHRKSQQKGAEGFSLSELESESSLLVITGSDTTAIALANVLFNLLNNPETLTRLTEEIRSRFTEIGQIRVGSALNECEYLLACIKEGLRLNPVVGGCLQREVLKGGIAIDGHHIPKGVDVGVPHHVIMRNGDYFDDPWIYDPRRWISAESNENSIARGRSAFCAFGLGPTGCVGKMWAMIEMKLTLAQLVFRYDMQMVIPDDVKRLSSVERLRRRDRESTDRFVVTSQGPYVKFRLRD